jgi:hypothetical protein
MVVIAMNKSSFLQRPNSFIVTIGLFLVRQVVARSGAIFPQRGAGHAAKPSCIILKRMGPVCLT